jgi:hypothetical protein
MAAAADPHKPACLRPQPHDRHRVIRSTAYGPWWRASPLARADPCKPTAAYEVTSTLVAALVPDAIRVRPATAHDRAT